MTLGYLARGLVQILAAHFIVSTLVAIALTVYWRRAAEQGGAAVMVARRLFLLRLAPAAVGLLTGLLIALAYGLWESKVEHERVGPAALACAAGGLLVVVAAAWRMGAVLRETRRIHQELARAATGPLNSLPLPAFIVDFGFPIVALVGLLRARLFVARTVIDACTPDELDAIVAHEQAHAQQRDNLRRLALSALPDVLGLAAADHRMHDEWVASAELAADERAAARAARGLHLASALVKVARLATGPTAPLPASALYRGEPITDRIRRLLDATPPTDARRWPAWARAVGITLLLAAAAGVLPLLHHAAEEVLKLGL